MNANSQVVKDNISLTEAYQETKQLKEELLRIHLYSSGQCKAINEYRKENDDLKQRIGELLNE